MCHAYTEDHWSSSPPSGVFAELGWQTVSAMDETFGPTGTLQRETKSATASFGGARGRDSLRLERGGLGRARPPRIFRIKSATHSGVGGHPAGATWHCAS